MKFQHPSLILFLNGRTDRHTDACTDKPKPICSHIFKVGGIKMDNFQYFTDAILKHIKNK